MLELIEPAANALGATCDPRQARGPNTAPLNSEPSVPRLHLLHTTRADEAPKGVAHVIRIGRRWHATCTCERLAAKPRLFRGHATHYAQLHAYQTGCRLGRPLVPYCFTV